MRASFLFGFGFLLSTVGLLAACGDDTGSTSTSGGGAQGQGGEGDGKFHPPANGTPMSEEAACEALRDALQSELQSFQASGCVMTLRTCPSLVQTIGGEPCLQYDQGTIQGCVTYYQDSASCDELKTRSDSCAFEAIAGSAPGGCP